jgi:DNA-binding transcriptional LysR family regulator
LTVDSSLLADFLSLAQCAHFSRAAQARHMTQPAFSRRIRTLEEWVGAALFDRACQPVALTEAGLRFLTPAREILHDLDLVREQAGMAGAMGSATLHFAATHLLSLSFFADWMKSLEGAESFGSIRLTSDTLEACEQILVQGQVQFLLCPYRPGAPRRLDEASYPSVRVAKGMMVPVAAVGPDGARFTLPGGPDRPVPLLAYSPEAGMGQHYSAGGGCGTQGPWLKPVFTSHLAAVLKAMALEGRGVAWLPLPLVAGELQAETLVRAGDASWDLEMEVRLIRFRGPLTPAAERFWDRLKAQDRTG